MAQSDTSEPRADVLAESQCRPPNCLRAFRVRISRIAGRIWPRLPTHYKSARLLSNAIRITAIAMSRRVMGIVAFGRVQADMTLKVKHLAFGSGLLRHATVRGLG